MADVRLTDPMSHVSSRDLLHLNSFDSRVGNHIPTSTKYWFPKSGLPKVVKPPSNTYISLAKRNR